MKADCCPACGKPADPQYRPFCSRGCKDRDLLQWLAEGYRIPGPAADPDLPGPWPETGVDKPDNRD